MTVLGQPALRPNIWKLVPGYFSDGAVSEVLEGSKLDECTRNLVCEKEVDGGWLLQACYYAG